MSDRKQASFDERRRTFLRTVGLAAGAAAVNPAGMLFGGTHRGDAGIRGTITRLPRIGVLMPGASMGRYGGEHFMSGFSCHLDEVFQASGIKAEITVDEYEKNPHMAMEKAAAMIESGNIDIVIAPLNADIAARLHPVLKSHRKIFINTDAGANILRDSERSPFVFNSSLSHWQANYELGRHAAAQYGKKVMIAASLYEGGYDAVYAFRIGVEEAGGMIAGTHVAHGVSAMEEMKSVITQIRQTAPDVVCAMYGGADAAAFLNLYAQSGMFRRIPLVASSFTVDAPMLRAQGVNIGGLRDCRAWSREIGTDANNNFIQRYEAFAHHRADVFSVLGYDTAHMIVEAVRLAGGAAADTESLCAALASVRVESPRGMLSMDASTHTVVSPLYICEAGADGSGTAHSVLQKIEPAPALHPALVALQSTMRSGFFHSYLTV